MRKTTLVLVLAAMCQFPLLATAQQADRSLTIRGILIVPDDDSQTIADTGSRFAVNTTASAEFAFTYLFTDTLAVESMLSATRFDLTTQGGTVGGRDAGSVWMAPGWTATERTVTAAILRRPRAGTTRRV